MCVWEWEWVVFDLARRALLYWTQKIERNEQWKITTVQHSIRKDAKSTQLHSFKGLTDVLTFMKPWKGKSINNMERNKCEKRKWSKRRRSGDKSRTSLAENQSAIKMVDVISSTRRDADITVHHCLSSHFYTDTLWMCVWMLQCRVQRMKGLMSKIFSAPSSLQFSCWLSLHYFIPHLYFHPHPVHLLTAKQPSGERCPWTEFWMYG